MLAIYKRQFRRFKPVVEFPEGLHGRQVCNRGTKSGRQEYKRRTEKMEIRQDFKCAICKRFFLVMTFDHQDGRGSNGSHRDDRVLDEKGEWKNAALCEPCNKWKASRRYRWIGGEYLPVEKFKGEAA